MSIDNEDEVLIEKEDNLLESKEHKKLTLLTKEEISKTLLTGFGP